VVATRDAVKLLPSFPVARSQRFEIILQQLHCEFLVAEMAPAIALDAADQHLTIVVNLREWAAAVAAGVVPHFAIWFWVGKVNKR